MKSSVTLVVATLNAVSTAAFAACENPSIATVPDGSSATMEQLLEAQAGVKAYMAAMEVYLACINEELETAGDDAPAEFKSLMVTRHNTAIAEMETVADAFNQQVKAYRAAHPEDSPQQ